MRPPSSAKRLPSGGGIFGARPNRKSPGKEGRELVEPLELQSCAGCGGRWAGGRTTCSALHVAEDGSNRDCNARAQLRGLHSASWRTPLGGGTLEMTVQEMRADCAAGDVVGGCRFMGGLVDRGGGCGVAGDVP
jgi:hypothetical protein